ncbi:related to HOL1 protein [Phialocephala subalpina]|uniref:Related to HOL1 protein n=1 Tax=Phialocephala subalpina TaxID=576137 RepID=A0A1L7XA24_9HELO|nr:related to HOL1 protein [Phialocephala subalpina]
MDPINEKEIGFSGTGAPAGVNEVKDKESLGGENAMEVKVDKHELPLVPQPSAHEDDPLNWSPSLKLLICIQVSWLAALGPMSCAVINPAFVPLGKAFHITTVEASYTLTMYIVFAGVGPLLFTPFSNIYGRRPIYLIGNLVAGVMNIIASHCTTWTGIMITRAITGIAAGCTVAIGGATICDLFFMHERGLFMGIYTFALTNGPHLSPLIGGYIGQRLGWRYCFAIPGYMQLATFVITVFCLPETLYSRKIDRSSHSPKSYLDLLLFKRSVLTDRKLGSTDFLRPFYMLKYISILIPGIYYMLCFGFGTVVFAATGAQLFAKLYHFNVEQTGILMSVPLIIGGLIGEFSAGWVTDYMVYRYAKKHNGQRKPEARLDAIWLALLTPIGVIIQGVCLTHYKTASWVGSAFGMGIASLGLQVATTVVYAYCTDCYKPQSAEVSTILNTFRQVFSSAISFYAIPLANRISIQYAWLVFSMISIVGILPVFALRIYGANWRARAWQSPPTFHTDL